MVNSLNDRRWVIDTVDADVIADNAIKVKSVRWAATTLSVATDAVVIRDPVNNDTLWETTASGANYVEEALLETWWKNGFEVPTLDRGILYITMH